MSTGASLVARFIAIPESWPMWARAMFLAASPFLFVAWLVALVVSAILYAAIALCALLILGFIEFPAFCHFLGSLVSDGGAERVTVLENFGRVE